MNSEDRTARVFVAIQLPESIRTALRSVQAELKSLLPHRSTAWARPENMHLTLRFLGNVDVLRLPELQSRLRESLADFGSIELCCERLGCFPDLRFPRVVWAWVHDAPDRLGELAQHPNLAVEGFAKQTAEARFVGHITLARPKQINRQDAQRLAAFVEGAVARQFGCWTCREVELIRSELSTQGSRYTTLDVFPL